MKAVSYTHLDVYKRQVYSVLIGLSCSGLGILPGFIAGYLMSFVVKFLEEKLPSGLRCV